MKLLVILLLIILVIVCLIASVLVRTLSNKKAESPVKDEDGDLQDMFRSLKRMEDRVEVLETLLQDMGKEAVPPKGDRYE